MDRGLVETTTLFPLKYVGFKLVSSIEVWVEMRPPASARNPCRQWVCSLTQAFLARSRVVSAAPLSGGPEDRFVFGRGLCVDLSGVGRRRKCSTRPSEAVRPSSWCLFIDVLPPTQTDTTHLQRKKGFVERKTPGRWSLLFHCEDRPVGCFCGYDLILSMCGSMRAGNLWFNMVMVDTVGGWLSVSIDGFRLDRTRNGDVVRGLSKHSHEASFHC